MARSRNPLAFTPIPVTILTSAIYIAIFAVLLVIHHQVPPPPSVETPKQWPGVNLTQAWSDLQTLCAEHHPYNSRANLEVRAWLQERIINIFRANEIEWGTERTGPDRISAVSPIGPADAVFIDDRSSNITFPDPRPYITYFEGDNLMVYIRGTADPTGRFWRDPNSPDAHLVLVNAHYDSVSTGYGATDDGTGVISCLQLISHFTHPDTPKPKHGLLVLINDAEEDGLYGAAAYTKHPMSRHASAFLNLEGAGAGGRATLFRATDAEVTRLYGASEHPFGSVASADAFKLDVVRSDTDWTVFKGKLGMRGLDVAFMSPRSLYHTPRDDVKDTSRASVWHMLSAALATTTGLVAKEWEKGSEYEVPGVWFDVFGLTFAVLRLHTLFALSVTLLAVGPVVLIGLHLLLKKQGKWYPFSINTYLHGEDDDEPVKLYGLKGLFRFPLAVVVSTAVVVCLALLVTKINPFIVYSSPYAAWAMMLSAFVALSWFLLRLGDTLRPSALSRFYTLLWIYSLSWIFLVGATIGADRFDLGAGYYFTIYNASVFVALLISYLDFFALPTKDQYANHVTLGVTSRRESRSTRPSSSHANADSEATERTALLSPSNPDLSERQSFARYNQSRDRGDDGSVLDFSGAEPYENEQGWSSQIPRWTWLIQAIVLLPINLILVGQGGLLLTSALAQTPSDGNPILIVYMAIAILSVLMLILTAPFLHRMVWQVPAFLFLVFIGTLIYNLVAEPFSRDQQLKVFFVQRVELETGRNEVALLGIGEWVEKVVAELPSAAGREVECGHNIRPWAVRNELRTCVWEGLEPNVLSGYHPRDSKRVEKTKKPEMKDWLSVSKTRLNSSLSESGSRYAISLAGLNTRACRLYFSSRVTNFTVLNACPHVSPDVSDPYSACPQGLPVDFPNAVVDEEHNSQLRLWSREFDDEFRVVVDSDEKEVKGTAVCLWSDANQLGRVPALDEVVAYGPEWSVVTKQADGLVEGWKEF